MDRPTVAFSKTHPALARALADRDYSDPTPVQAAVLADDTEGRDLLVSAQTGSGKTVVIGAAETLGPAERPLALVVAPTRGSRATPSDIVSLVAMAETHYRMSRPRGEEIERGDAAWRRS